ncbi:hypothetical protein IE077_002507 [Cardiosporidium cionae]|uniref:HIT domain-containing protein n=1 Tax=Cardiosporidium cionae TaxID=476202 RepID=A0ABQ7JAS5_9APIC|nr:hypothetical protein IE077_002507 [Cardiosporidium cionae]|eukprot:KAF8821055.1 hypothetical protein IE077_002507 [Cardiosporidium cionae]
MVQKPHAQVKGVIYSKNGEILSCVFCRIYAGNQIPAQRILYKDSSVFVIMPRSPCARIHLLICPVEHIHNINSLCTADLALLHHMKSIANKILFGKHYSQFGAQNDCADSHRFVFHVPPWNSIDHLHLHALLLPFHKFGSKISYSFAFTPWCCSLDRLVISLKHQPRDKSSKRYNAENKITTERSDHKSESALITLKILDDTAHAISSSVSGTSDTPVTSISDPFLQTEDETSILVQSALFPSTDENVGNGAYLSSNNTLPRRWLSWHFFNRKRLRSKTSNYECARCSRCYPALLSSLC